ncbi:hypothetical protein KIF53_17695 [Chromobacterium subtsugae]|uniref:Uncharacterized protein n=1 Tax=Chromobacterium subtsugae TaxID=251747 RepID=A0ABS7FIC0_9NEIS|nr:MULTISPECIES: hypothetical protein [Chromobacterium]KUM03554.1 hypothetical protein Cv017_18830 [Chromobacterium subtsugae]KZE88317.1 hypothetical protein AWB61_00080 [Chromobacterium sp. F49]MBW7568699.1 hypothetical protein [Chromobacterium subtsugae]MBW8289471.1 hypothetical protein [Chromobacterium subtsugae]WSE89988.1 hypothetical protein U6115_13935 [Chromobacterium subtsugae]
MQLPDALKPWHDCLSGFSAELAPEMGELLRRLSPALGRFQAAIRGGDEAPQGVDALQRRGPYERLLASEWLLADELPDEFLRRAAGNEHLFLAPTPRESRASSRILALFHCGNLQLGAARLAHLALCILLERRASAAGGDFAWGSLQAPGEWREGAQTHALRQLLATRSYRNFNQECSQQWLAALDQLETRPGECWLIGYPLPDKGLAASAFTHQVDIRPTLDGDALDIVVRDRAGQRKLTLPLPPQAAGRALLAGNFDTQAEARQLAGRFSLRHAPLLSPDGSHVAAFLLGEKETLLLHVPKPGRSSRQKPRRVQWSSAGSALGLAFTRKTVGAVAQLGDTLAFSQLPGLGKVQLPPQDMLQLAPGAARLLDAAWLQHDNCARLYARDRVGNLVFWVAPGKRGVHSGPAPGTTHLQLREVLAMCQQDARTLLYVRHQAGQLRLGRLWAEPPSGSTRPAAASSRQGPLGPLDNEWTVPGACAADSEALLGFAQPNLFACAVRQPSALGECWRLHAGRPHAAAASIDYQLPPGWSALGLAPRADASTAFQLVLFHKAQNQLGLLCDGRILILYQPIHPIAKISYAPASAAIALLTEQRELIVYSVTEQCVALRLQGQAAPGEQHD